MQPKMSTINHFGFVYKWTDSKTGMMYIGSHYGNVLDSYKGSNTRFRRAIKKRSKDFFREILEYIIIDDKNLVLKCEQKWLDSIDNIKDNPQYYNKKNEASGGWSFISKKHVDKRSKTLKKKHKKNGLSKKESISYKTKIETRLKRIEEHGFTNKEKEQYSKYGYTVKITDSTGIETIFSSCGEASRMLNIDVLYGLKVCKTRESFKGFRCIKIKDPIIDCRGIK